MRTHVLISEELVVEVDALVGQRRRSRFFAEAVAEKLAQIKLLRAMEKAAGAIKEGVVPEWDSSESALEWVRQLRQLDVERLNRQQAASPES